MYPHDMDPMAPAKMERDRTGIREVPTGTREDCFTDSVGKSYEAIVSELGDLRQTIIDVRHKLLGPASNKNPTTPSDPRTEPNGDAGVFTKIERTNSRIYSDVTDLAGLMRDLLHRI